MADIRQPTSDSRQLPIIGREREQLLLREHLDALLSGRGGVVLISGEAGIGKTTLARWLATEAAAQGASVLVGGCYDLIATPPYGPWFELLERYRPVGTLPAALASSVGAAGAANQSALFGAFRTFLADAASARPLVVVLEDLHWADPASLELLRFLARQPAELLPLIVATYRDDEITREHQLFTMVPLLTREARVERIDLRRIDDADIATMVAMRYGLPSVLHQRLVQYLSRLSNGNFLYLTELLHTLEAERVLRSDAEQWTFGQLPQTLVPPLLRQVIDARLIRLRDETNQALAIAAIIGQEVPLGLWSAVSGLDEEQLADIVEEATAARVLEERPARAALFFSHALVREAIYERLPLPRRRMWHRRIAEELATQPNAQPDAVAYHFQQAGDERAYTWHIRAGEWSSDLAPISAARHFEAVLAFIGNNPARVHERAALLQLAGRHLAHSGDPRAITYLEEAETLFRAADEHALAAYTSGARGRMRCRTGDVRRGLPEIERAVADLDALMGTWQPADDYSALFPRLHTMTADTHPNTTHVTVNLQRGWLSNWLANSGRYRESISISEALLAEVHQAGDSTLFETHEVYNCRFGLAQSAGALGRPDDLRQQMLRYRAGEPASLELPLVELSYWLELLLVILPYHTDNLTERARLVADAQRIWALCRDVAITTAGDGAPSELQVDLLEGRWQKARQLASDHVPAPWLNHHHEGIATLSILDRLQGRPDDAWMCISQVLPDGPATEPGECYFSIVITAVSCAAELAMDNGNLELASRWIDAHDRWLAWSGARLWQADNLLLRARFEDNSGNAALARRHAETALTIASDPRQPLRLIAAWRVLGRLDTTDGQFESAATHLDRSIALAAACGAPFERAQSLLALAELHAAMANSDTAQALLDEARAICTPLEARPTLERIAALEAALGSVSSAAPTYPDGLTPREVEVLRLIATGASNRQIADTLYLSPRTVERHIANIYLKIDAHSKAEATAYALRHRLA